MRGLRFARKIVKLFVIAVIIGGISGILKVNETLPEAAQSYSAFRVTRGEKPQDTCVELGDYKISIDKDRFLGFIKGIEAIGNAVKNMTEKQQNNSAYVDNVPLCYGIIYFDYLCK